MPSRDLTFRPLPAPQEKQPASRLSALAGLVLLAALVSSSCVVGPDYRAPSTPAPARFTRHEVPRAAGDFPSDAVDAAWWRRFDDPLLDQLVTLASDRNHDLRIAQARLLEARALWTEARFDLLPTIRSEASYENSQTSRATRPDEARQRRHNEVYRFGFDATWELDLWGRVRRGVEAARATVAAVEATRDETLVVVRAELAANYLDLRGLQAQLEVARRNATNQTETLRLAEALRDGGQGTQLDVARARSQLHSTLAGIPPIEAATEQTLHRLAVLCGNTPTDDSALFRQLALPAPLPRHRGDLATGDPAALLRRRPDIRAAERQLAAATARVGVDVADLFPRVTWQGNVGLEANRLSGFSGSGLEAWGFGPRISWAALDLGRVRQRIRASQARTSGDLARYEQTVLLALEETADSLVNLARERERLASLIEAESSAAEAVELARQRYRDGIADFLSVLDSERTLLALQDQRVASSTRELTRLVAVYKALAGGWEEPKREDTPPTQGAAGTSP